MRTTAYNLARFDLVSVRLAVACAQTGSLTAAARETHLALAAASRRIRELENAVDSPLFVRHTKGLLPTAAGRVFVKHGLALLHTMDEIGAELADLQQGIARHIRLHSSSAAITEYLPPLLARHAELHPNVRIDVEEMVSELVVASLREGRTDVAVFVEGPDVSDMSVRSFRSDELIFVLPKGHPLARSKKPLFFVDTLDEEQICLSAGAASLQKQRAAALAVNRPLKIRMQLRSFEAVCHMVAAGLGIALLPKGATQPLIKSLQLAWRPLGDAWGQRNLLIAVGQNEEDPGILDFVNFLAESALSEAGQGPAAAAP
ncbi:LysR family transcriptional regulator [Propionivibrio dicarboxylicus]|uniref:Transcriptional regulator, LysR family n=1 Tax=Propionivibrio dicarboxylicus TaxID=83767 RepID=A0A1G8GXH9_9RHOO|nr:LysR family transcriptional regulator [Propionivibrio dicarboxylicus]SDH99103.1 transcriptional regulator, LysR family [Propionivibrio dicarboxylicus]